MRTSRLFTILMMLLAAGLTMGSNAQFKKEFTKNPISDIVLIYQGNLQRPDWTIDQFTPYVTHTYGDGSRSWLFQGFIFIEFATKEVAYINSMKNKRNAVKTDWEWLLNRVFEKNKALDALDKCIERQKATLGAPPFRHKVILCLPVPIKDQTDWGKIGSSRMDFSKEKDQLKAVEWYMNELLKRFKNGGYKNIDLEGFYWVEEDMVVVKDAMLKQVSDMVHKAGKRFYWSPYNFARGCMKWDSAGFDYAYMQPNYVIKAKHDEDYLTGAIEKAKNADMALEFDFDQKLLLQPDQYIPRLSKAIDIYEQGHVFDDCALIYYDGGGTLMSIYEGVDPHYGKVDKKRYSAVLDRLARHIVNRWPSNGTTYQLPNNPYTNGTVNTPSQPSVNEPKKSYDWRDPEYWHF